LQKALRGLETGHFGLGCDRLDRWGTRQQPTIDEISAKLATPTAERVWFLRYALKAGLTVDDIYARTRIAHWVWSNLRELVEMEDRLGECTSLSDVPYDLLFRAKQYGFSDKQLAHIWHTTENEVRRARKALGIEAVFKLVDTCAAEFEAYTPYY